MTRSATPLLFAWDLGRNWGHVKGLLALNDALQAENFRVFAAVNNVRAYGQQLADKGIRVLQSPVSQAPPGTRLRPASLAHIFHNRGYADVRALGGMVEAWRNLIQLTGARLLLVDAAPPALIAARTLGVPVLNMSAPFHVPPRQRPFFPFADRLDERDMFSSAATPPVDVLEVALDRAMCHVLSAYGKPPPARFADLFDVDEGGFFCWPQLDPFGDRGLQRYWGPLTGDPGGASFAWPSGDGPRVFAYLRPEFPAVITLLSVLARSGWPVVAACPGLSGMQEAERRQMSSPTTALHDGLLNIRQAAAEADFAVGNGGQGFTHAMLAAGRPIVSLPTDMEKTLTTQRVVEAGAGASLLACRDGAAMDVVIKRVGQAGAEYSGARQLAAMHRMNHHGALPEAVAQRCRELAGNSP